jgi:hypothetical protein
MGWADRNYNERKLSMIKTCMNCGTSGCDHKDARRCASGNRSLWTLPTLNTQEIADTQARERYAQLLQTTTPEERSHDFLEYGFC